MTFGDEMERMKNALKSSPDTKDRYSRAGWGGCEWLAFSAWIAEDRARCSNESVCKYRDTLASWLSVTDIAYVLQWLFCKSGYFSAVKHNAKPNTILLRARVKGDLERLADAHQIDMKIRHTPSADYAYRAELSAAEWTRAVMEESDAIDYGNFKNAVHDGTARDDAYMAVWCAMSNLQDKYRRG